MAIARNLRPALWRGHQAADLALETLGKCDRRAILEVGPYDLHPNEPFTTLGPNFASDEKYLKKQKILG